MLQCKMEYGKKAQLIDGPVGKTLTRLTIPMIIGIAGMVAFNLIDTFFIAQLGTIELAAISFTFPVVFLITSIALGLGVGTSAVISRAIGEGDQRKVKRLTTDALSLSVLIVVSLVMVGMLTIEPLFRLLGASEEILPFIKKYMTIWYPGVAFVIIPMVGNSAIRATGDTRTPSLIMMVSVAVNLLLDPLLIFGIGPFPRWELAGAAVATVVARAVSLLVSLWILHHRDKMLSFVRPRARDLWNSWKQVLYIGLPAAGNNLIIPLSMGIIIRLVSGYGPDAIAALGVATRIDMFALTLLMALSSVLTPFVGQNWGAGRMKRIRRAVQLSFRFSMAWGSIVFLLFIPLARPLAKLFTETPAVIEAIVAYLRLVSFSYGCIGIAMLAGAAFNALNKPMPAAILTFVRMVLLYIPLAYLGSHLWGLHGIFGAASLAFILGGLGAYIWWRRTAQHMTRK